MVNIFIAHSGCDKEQAFKIRNYFEQRETISGEALPASEFENRHANVLVLQGTNTNWKREAKKLISKAQIVLFVQGATSASSDNIKWEIETAVKMNKIVMVHQLDSYDFPEWLKKVDPFTGREVKASKVYTLEQIKNRIDSFDMGMYNIFSKDIDTMLEKERSETKKQLFDQYKMYQQTSETLVARRQSVNSFYISVNAALVTFLGAVAGFVNMPTKLIVLSAVAIAGFIIDISWLKILDAYGTLNSSKMKVINLIEQQLPLKLYDAEWEIMSDKLNSKKYVSFTDSEKRIPKIFSVLYILVTLGSAAIYLLQQFM